MRSRPSRKGCPYTHLLGLHAGQHAVHDDRTAVTVADVAAAIPKAVDRHTILSDFQRATPKRSQRRAVLTSSTRVRAGTQNELGFYTTGAIRDPLEVIAGRRLEIPAFSNHLSQFLEPDRGPCCSARAPRGGTSIASPIQFFSPTWYSRASPKGSSRLTSFEPFSIERRSQMSRRERSRPRRRPRCSELSTGPA